MHVAFQNWNFALWCPRLETLKFPWVRFICVSGTEGWSDSSRQLDKSVSQWIAQNQSLASAGRNCRMGHFMGFKCWVLGNLNSEHKKPNWNFKFLIPKKFNFACSVVRHTDEASCIILMWNLGRMLLQTSGRSFYVFTIKVVNMGDHPKYSVVRIQKHIVAIATLKNLQLLLSIQVQFPPQKRKAAEYQTETWEAFANDDDPYLWSRFFCSLSWELGSLLLNPQQQKRVDFTPNAIRIVMNLTYLSPVLECPSDLRNIRGGKIAEQQEGPPFRTRQTFIFEFRTKQNKKLFS